MVTIGITLLLCAFVMLTSIVTAIAKRVITDPQDQRWARGCEIIAVLLLAAWVVGIVVAYVF